MAIEGEIKGCGQIAISNISHAAASGRVPCVRVSLIMQEADEIKQDVFLMGFVSASLIIPR